MNPTAQSPQKTRIYLAGPEVFLREAMAIGAAKKQICEAFGFEGVYPIDAAIDLSGYEKRDAGLLISANNQQLIRTCDLVIANITPFRGISADPGTVYELGFAAGLGKRLYAYTNVADNLTARTLADPQQTITRDSLGQWRDQLGMLVEDFELHDNLMIDGGIAATGGKLFVHAVPDPERFTSLEAFRQCVRHVFALQPSSIQTR